MNKRIVAMALAAAAGVLLQPATHAQSAGPGLLRVLLVVDSSLAVQSMLNPFRAAVTNFVAGLPASAEVLMATTGGQFHLKVPPTLDHARLLAAGKGFTADGGANTLLDTVLEADERFLRKEMDRRPVIVILTTDGPQGREQNRIDAYNTFMKSFVARGGRAHGIVIRGGVVGAVTDLVQTLVQNTDGYYESITIETVLPDKVKRLVAFVAADSH